MRKIFSFKTFVISQLFLLAVGLSIIGGLYFFPHLLGQDKPKPQIRGPVTSAPASLNLDLTGPDDDLLSFQDEVVVEGKTSPRSNVLISSESNDEVVEAKADGSFSTNFSLKPGVNEIQVVVFDSSGDQRSSSRTIYYSKEKI